MKKIVKLFALLVIVTSLSVSLIGCKGGCDSCSTPKTPTQPVACHVDVNPTAINFPAGGGSQKITVTKTGECAICSAPVPPSWGVSITQNTDGTWQATAPATTVAHSGPGTVCGLNVSFTQDAPVVVKPACSWGFPPTTPTWPAAGETSFGVGFVSTCVGVTVTAQITSNPGDMLFNMNPVSQLTAPDGKDGGMGTIEVNKRANTGGARVAIITWTTPDGSKFTTQVPQDAAAGH